MEKIGKKTKEIQKPKTFRQIPKHLIHTSYSFFFTWKIKIINFKDSDFYKLLRLCAISALQISKNHFAIFDFFVKTDWKATTVIWLRRRPRICINENPPFQTSLDKIFKNYFLWRKSYFTILTFRGDFKKYIWLWKGGFQMMQILGILGMYFDAAEKFLDL